MPPMANPQQMPPPSPYGGGAPQGGDKGGDGKSGIAALLAAILGSNAGPIPKWAAQQPKSTTQLLRQLSANAGQMPMPGGPVGAVLQPSFGSSRPATTNYNPATYGQNPGMGEATFFRQSMLGGMTPLSALTPLGVPKGWNPFGTFQKKHPDPHGGKPNGGGNGNGAGGGGIDLSDMGK